MSASAQIRTSAGQPVSGDLRMGDNVGVGPDQNIRFEHQCRIRHRSDFVGETHAIVMVIVIAIDEPVCARIFGVARFEFSKPCRQTPHHWSNMIGLEMLRIKIEWNVGGPELSEGLDHAAAVLLPSRLMARREDREARQSTIRERSSQGGKCAFCIIVFQAD